MKNYIIYIYICIQISCSGSSNRSVPSDPNQPDVDFKQSDSESSTSNKQIEWSNGNIYSYDYTETISTKDSIGNETLITVYKVNAPNVNNVICDTKVCKWCSNEVDAEDYVIEEYPNINWVRGQPDLQSIFGIFTLIIDGNKYYDLDNNRIRTEWRVNCSYPGPGEFCSLKCENEFKYR